MSAKEQKNSWKKSLEAPVQMEVKNGDRNIVTPKWETTSNQWEINKNVKSNQKTEKRPLGTYRLFPSLDPYNGIQRAQFRAVNQQVSWVNRANRLMVQAEVGAGFTTTIEQRNLKGDQQDEQADTAEWQTLQVPLFGKEMPAMELKQWIDDLAEDLQLQQHMYRARLYSREQGISCIAMFPENRQQDEYGRESGPYMLPQRLRTIRPEHLNKVWLNLDTGDMDSVQVIGVLSNGGRLPAERMVWLMNGYNLELNSDYYGQSDILPILDAARTMAILYGKDFQEAAQYTWHQPKVFQVTVPPRDYANVTGVLGQFLRKANNSQGRDIAVTQSVELISGQTNTGDLAGLIALDDHLIDQVAGYYNIPPYLLSKGKAGNLGGDAQKEEIDGFLNMEVRPKQEMIETQMEEQFYDKILMILFQVDDPSQLKVRIRMHLAKPDIETLFNKEQYEVLMDMTNQGIISADGMVKRLGVEHLRKETEGTGIATPPKRTIIGPKWSPHWGMSESGWDAPEGMTPLWNNRPTWPIMPEKEEWTDKKKTAV